MKRLVSLVLVMLMALCACASAEVTYPLTTEPVTITIAVAQHNSDAVEDFNTKYAIKEANEVTGINIEWIPVQEGNNEMVATLLDGDLPDVFLGLVNDTQIMENSSMFVQTENLIEQYCPNIFATYEEYVDGWRNYLTYPDGHMYGLIANYRAAYGNSLQGTMWINKVWLDNLGLEVPTNLAELEVVLAAFRDNDANGNGDATDEIPFDWCQKHYAAKYWEMGYSFGLPKYYDIVDGKIEKTVTKDAFRTFLEYYHELCASGLANIEGLTQTEEQYFANLANGKVGVFTGWAPYTYMTDPAQQAQYIPTGPLSADGFTFRVEPTRLTANRCGFVITSACENVELALQWWDYLSRDQVAAHTARSGPEGLTWELVDGVPTSRVYTPEEAVAFGYEEISGHAGTSTFAASMGLTNCPPLIVDSLAPVAGSTSQIRFDAVELYEEYWTDVSMPKSVVPADAQEEYDFTCEGLTDYIDNFAADSILNGVTDDSWNAFISGLDTYSYDYYIEFHQNKLDGTF